MKNGNINLDSIRDLFPFRMISGSLWCILPYCEVAFMSSYDATGLNVGGFCGWWLIIVRRNSLSEAGRKNATGVRKVNKNTLAILLISLHIFAVYVLHTLNMKSLGMENKKRKRTKII